MISSARSRTRGSLISALRALLIAIEWCGIIAFMKRTSPTNVWLLLIASSATPRIRAPARTATLSAMPLYIDHMKPSITIVITEPMMNAAIRRLRLNIRCSDEYTNWYIRQNMMKVETAIIAENRHQDRKSVVKGKRESVRVNLGGRGHRKKKKK